MTVYTFDENTISDLHKDARGSRPGEYWWNQWNASTDEEKQSIWDSLIEEFECRELQERRIADESVKDFKSDINQHIALGASDHETALRWMTQNEEFYNDQCVEHWVWNKGILFTDYGRNLVKELKSIVTFKEYA
jgi:LPS O-antigen subunit length determinant protein (WzzB/FepE family)